MSYNAQLRSNNEIRNHEGAKAWMQTPEFELYSTVVCTMSIDDKFYESASDRVNRIASLVRMVPAKFVAQLAVYARTEMHLRSVPMLLLVELSQCHSGDSLVSLATAKTIQRVDDITELLACYQWRHRSKDLKRLSNQLRKGIADAFNKFDEYQFAKYNRNNKKVTLRDALFLVHPKAKDEAQQVIFDKIAANKLEVPYTWETQLSQAGQTRGMSHDERQQLKQNTWKTLIESHRMGYMAMLRNLRNMLSCELDDATMQIVYDYLSDEQAVKQSRQLPFRFFSAFLMMTGHLAKRKVKNPYQDIISALQAKSYSITTKRQNLSRYYIVKKRVTLRKRFNIYGSNMRFVISNTEYYNDLLPPWHVAVVRSYWVPQTRMRRSLKKYMTRLEARERKTNKSLERLYHLSDILQKGFFAPSQTLECLETAVKHSASNIPAFSDDTRVCIACDTSGSMMHPVSDNSIVECYDLALFFGAMMKHRCANSVVGMFGDTWLPVEMPQNNIMQNVMKMRELEGQVGYSTNGYKVIEWLIEKQKVMDKVMIFTDCQLWNSKWHDASLISVWKTYKATVAPDAKLYLFDLAGYGQSPIDMDAEKDVYCIAGWSDKVFDMLAAIENGKSVIDEIRRIAV